MKRYFTFGAVCVCICLAACNVQKPGQVSEKKASDEVPSAFSSPVTAECIRAGSFEGEIDITFR